nr:MAG TPA: hypothetical protein [Caudoviricetes sp.]
MLAHDLRKGEVIRFCRLYRITGVDFVVHVTSLSDKYISALVHRHVLRQNQSGANTIDSVVGAIVVVGAIRPDDPDTVDVVSRRAQPPSGSAAAVVGDTLAVAARAASKVVKLCTIFREIAVVAGRPAHLITRQQKHFGAQTIGASINAVAVVVRNLYLLDSVADVTVNLVEERTVQVAVNTGLIVVVKSAEFGISVDVFHQQPSAAAAIVIDAGRLALMDDDEIFGHAANFYFDGSSHRQTAYGATDLVDEPGLSVYADIHLPHLSGFPINASIELGHFVCRAPDTKIYAHAPTPLCVHQQDGAGGKGAAHAGVGGLRPDAKTVDAGHAQGAVLRHAEASASLDTAQRGGGSGGEVVGRTELCVCFFFGVKTAVLQLFDLRAQFTRLLLHGRHLSIKFLLSRRQLIFGLLPGIRFLRRLYRLPLLHQLCRRDPGHAVPHDAADGFVGAGVGDVGGGDALAAGLAGDRGKAEVIDQCRAGDLRRRGAGGARGALQHQQARLAGGGVVSQHDAVNAGAHRVGGGQGDGLGLLHDDAAAFEPRRAHPRLPRADGHAQLACGGDGEVLVRAVHAAQAGGEEARSVVGVIGDAVFRVCDEICHTSSFRFCASWGCPAGWCGWCRCPDFR